MIEVIGKTRQAWRDFKHWFRNLDGRDRLELTFQGTIVLLTFGFLLFAKWQLDEISDSSKDTKAIAEAAKQQADNTKILAESTKSQADAATAGVKAWIAVTKWQVIGIQDSYAKFSFTLKNVGKSPAFNVQGSWEFRVVPSHVHDQKFESCPVTGPLLQPGTVHPDQEWIESLEQLLSSEQIKMLADQSVRLWGHGCTRFTDVFNNARYTEVAFIYPTFSGRPGMALYPPNNKMN